MEMVESCVQDEDGRVSIPRGGPIYLPNLVGPLTRVADFKASLRQHLQDLEAEICLDSSQACGEDISVDELKIFTEEELVSKAFEEAFKDSVEADKSSPIAEEHSNAGRKDNCKISSNKCVYLKRSGKGRDLSASFESLNGSPSGSGCNRKTSSRKRRVQSKRTVENSYIPKVEQLAKIKQKQDEDKAAARLHSFNGSCKINDCAIQFSGKIEKLTSLRSTNSATKD